MADIVASNITKSFVQDRVILDDISFQIDAGEHVAILGDNGAGKTTLFRIITGEITPDSGRITIPQNKRIGYVAQLNETRSDATVEDVLKSAYSEVIQVGNELDRLHENMHSVSANHYDELIKRFEALGGYTWQSDLAKIANGLDIGPEMRAQPFSSLSGGEQTRVSLARIIMEQPDILLLDEPTNHLDIESLHWLEDYILHYKGTVLTISHDRYFLDTVAQRIIAIDHGKVDFYSGNYSYYVEERELRYQQQLMHYNREQAKVKQLEFQIARLKAWGSVYDNPALHKRAAAMEKRIERVQQTDKPTTQVKMHADFASESFRADIVLKAENIAKGFDGKNLFGPFTAEIRGGGEHIALIGPNGCGKTTFLKLLLDQLQPDRGRITLGPSVKLAYLPQVITFEHPERTIYDTMLYETGCQPQEARDRLGAFRFREDEQFKTVSQLSGGEKTRLMLCIIMRNRANLLILDEPTNHLDLASREWIEEAVSHFDGTLLFVSHDRYFIKRFATRIWEMGTEFKDWNYDYERYLAIKANNAAKAKQAPVQKKAEPQKETKKTGNSKTERQLNALEREIAAKEAELSLYDEKMQAVASDYIALGRLEEEKAALEAVIEEMYSRWEEMAASLNK